MLRGSLDGRGVWGRMDTCICMAELLCCAPETITTLLIGYTPKTKKHPRYLGDSGARGQQACAPMPINPPRSPPISYLSQK